MKMNPHETIQKLQLGETVNRLISALINTRNVKSNLYIGTMEIVKQGEPRLGQTKWIPRKVANISLPLASLRSEFRDAKKVAL